MSAQNKEGLFQIGEVARLFHLSVSSLRHYEQIGLLKPEWIDPKTGYRYFSTQQFESLNTIRYLRALDMPISAISDFLNNRDLDKSERLLAAQKEEVIRRKCELERIERKIENRLNQLQTAKSSAKDQVEVRVIPEQRIAWIRKSFSISTKQEPAFETSIRQLEQDQNEALVFLGKVGVGISPERLNAKCFDQYDRVFLILDPEDDYTGATELLPKQTCVTIRFCGSHTDAKTHYQKLLEYMDQNGFEPAGNSREITMIDFGMTTDTNQFVTEISIPIREPKKEKPAAD